MSQSYHHLPNTPLRSSNASQPVPAGLVGAMSQATTGEDLYAERSRVNDEVEDLSTGTGNPVLFPAGDNDTWSQDAQEGWIPGFRGRVSE
jgi:hypothetical protein